jgi:glycerol uptake facilitator-like aquaporin
MFIVAQLAGAAVATALVLVIYPRVREVADQVIVPHQPMESRKRW